MGDKMEYQIKFLVYFEADSQEDAENIAVDIWNSIRKNSNVIDSEPLALEPPTPTEDVDG